ncbi:MAG: hypothetical protein V4547_15560 [Bacteroidota bacterium]
MDTGNINKVFLSLNRFEQSKNQKRLLVTLQRAGFLFSSTLTESFLESNIESVKQIGNDIENVELEIQNSFCSIHFIEKKYFEYRDGISVSEHHFNEARKKIEKDEGYKTFIWMPGKFDDSDADKRQLDFINRLQHHLSNNMILSRVPSAIQFVEDVRLILEQQAKKVFDTEPADVFLIVNQTDEKDADRIQMMLSGILKLVKLVIVQNSDIDYEEYAAQQMDVSKLSVIYYKNASDWALPFAQQIWKKVGGASAKSPILFISDADAVGTQTKGFIAPKVSCYNLPCELIPLEIKVHFDSLNEKK